jgi:hypothetical protein
MAAYPGVAHARDHVEELEQSQIPGLGCGWKRLFHFQQPYRALVHAVVRGLVRKCPSTLASEELSGHMGHSLTQREIRGHSSPHDRQQCLDGETVLTLCLLWRPVF